jgi:hypothetical protein
MSSALESAVYIRNTVRPDRFFPQHQLCNVLTHRSISSDFSFDGKNEEIANRLEVAVIKLGMICLIVYNWLGTLADVGFLHFALIQSKPSSSEY